MCLWLSRFFLKKKLAPHPYYKNEVQRLALLLQSNLAKQTSIIEQQQHQASHLQKVLLKDVLSHKDQNENNNPIPVDATTLSDFSSHIVSTAKEMLAAGSLDIPHLTQPEPSPQGLETETSESSQSSISSISAYPSAILTPKNMRQMLELIMKKNMRHILKSATVQATASSESANGIGQKVEAVVDESSSATTEPTTASIKESVPSSAAGRFGQADKILKTAKKYELSFADFSGPSMDLPYSSGGDSNPIPLDEQPQPHSLYDHQHEHHDHLQHNRKRQPDGNHLHISKHQHDKTGPECNPPIRGADSSSLLAPTSQKYFSNHFNLRGGVKAAATAQPAASMPSNTKPSSHSASYFMRGTGREEQQQKWQVAADAAAARNLKAAAAAATTKDSYSSGLFVTTSSSRVKSRESRSAAPPHHQNNLTRSRSPASSRISIQSDDSYLFVNDTSMLNSLIRVVSEMEAKETKPQGKKALPDIINKEDEDEDADELESVISSLNE